VFPEPEPAANVLTNGGFENNLNGWNTCAANNLLSSSSDADQGSAALSVTGGGCMYQNFAIEAGTSYRMDCRAKSEGTSLYSSISLSLMNSSYATLENAEVPVNSSSYSNLSTELTAPANSRYGAVVVYSEDVGLFDTCSVVANP